MTNEHKSVNRISYGYVSQNPVKGYVAMRRIQRLIEQEELDEKDKERIEDKVLKMSDKHIQKALKLVGQKDKLIQFCLTLAV